MHDWDWSAFLIRLFPIRNIFVSGLCSTLLVAVASALVRLVSSVWCALASWRFTSLRCCTVRRLFSLPISLSCSDSWIVMAVPCVRRVSIVVDWLASLSIRSLFVLTRLLTTASNCWTLEDVCRQHRQGQYVKSLSLFFKSTHVRWNHLQHRPHWIISTFLDPLYLPLSVQCFSFGGGRLTKSLVSMLLLSVGVACLFSIISFVLPAIAIPYAVELAFLGFFSTGLWNPCDLSNRSQS